MISFRENPRLGFYKVGEKNFYNKLQALVAATASNQFPEWHFNREVFDTFDWLNEPALDLRQLYHLRARQLREKYDYIRLEFSGGGDSTTVLYSFVNNGLFVDEVVLRYPKEGVSNLDEDPLNHKSENSHSELKYAAAPILKWLKLASPNTKITIHDYTQDTLSTTLDESWIYQTQEYFEPSWVYKHRVDGIDDHKRQLDRGQSVCVLWGIDKPKVCIKDKKWYLYFLDKPANVVTEYKNDYTNVEYEYFFWSADLPELLSKQAHIIKKWFSLPSNKYLQHLVRWPNHSFNQRTTFEHIVKPLIYEDYDPATFQVSKPTNNFYNEQDYWFYKNCQDTYTHRVWLAGLDHIVKNVDSKYFNHELGRAVGFVGFLSPFYYLGEADYEHNSIHTYQKVW